MPQTLRKDRDEIAEEVIRLFNLSKSTAKPTGYLNRTQLLELMAIGVEYKKHLTGEGVSSWQDTQKDGSLT